MMSQGRPGPAMNKKGSSLLGELGWGMESPEGALVQGVQGGGKESLKSLKEELLRQLHKLMYG